MIHTESKIGHLAELAGVRAAESTAELVSIIKDLFEDQSHVLSDREKNLMFKIIKALFHEVEVSVRAELSQHLADRDDVPHGLITYLANDKIQVAEPVLSRCVLLQDTDLIKVVHQRTEEYHMAITLRREVNEGVSEALVKTGHEEVIISLLNNENSRISESTMNYLVEQSKRVDTFQEPLIHHRDLNNGMAEKLFEWVSDTLRQDISKKFDLPPEIISKYLNLTDEKVIEKKRRLDEEIPDATRDLIRQLKTQGMITTEVLVAALNQGEVPLFIGLFAEITKLSTGYSADIILDGNGEEVAVACKAIGVTELQFVTIIKKIRKLVAPNKEKESPEHANEMAAFFRTVEPADAAEAIASWRNL